MKPSQPSGQVIDVVFLTDEPSGLAAVREDLALIATRLAALLDRVAAATAGASAEELTEVREGAWELAEVVNAAIGRASQPSGVRAVVFSSPSVETPGRVSSPTYRPLRANPTCSRSVWGFTAC